ncbi:MAG: hypothetical protein KA149_06995 [Chitinophagales bacterium]|nr:hypothetical protein [Chitinophagales bacterium]
MWVIPNTALPRRVLIIIGASAFTVGATQRNPQQDSNEKAYYQEKSFQYFIKRYPANKYDASNQEGDKKCKSEHKKLIIKF